MFKAPDVQPPATPGGSLDAAETGEGNRQMWPAGLGGRWQCEEVAVVWGDGAARSGPPLTALFAPLALFSFFFLSLFSPAACCCSRPRLAPSVRDLSSPPHPHPRIWARSPGTPCGEPSGVTLQDLRSESSGSWRGAGRPALPGTRVRDGEAGSDTEDQLHDRCLERLRMFTVEMEVGRMGKDANRYSEGSCPPSLPFFSCKYLSIYWASGIMLGARYTLGNAEVLISVPGNVPSSSP